MVLRGGVEPPSKDYKSYALTTVLTEYVAAVAGLEPANDGVKVRCLTTWLHRYIMWSVPPSSVCSALPKIGGVMKAGATDGT